MHKIRLLIIIIPSLAVALTGCKETPADNVFLLRKHMYKDSTLIELNTDCYYVENAGMNMNHGGWHWCQDPEDKETDFLYYEIETVGLIKLEFDLQKKLRQLTLTQLKN